MRRNSKSMIAGGKSRLCEVLDPAQLVLNPAQKF